MPPPSLLYGQTKDVDCGALPPEHVDGSGHRAGAAIAKDIVINMAAPDWLPTRFMQEEFDKTYKSKSGNNVKLVIDFIPWGSFYQRVAASLSSGEKKYQMIVTDSQWLGDFVEGGHYLKLNKYIDADPELQTIIADMHPVLLSTSSSYPYKSTNYYGFPQFPDNLVTAYQEGPVLQPNGASQFQEAVQPGLAVLLQRMGRRRLAAIGEHRQVLPPQEGRQARRRRGRRRFLRHRLSDGQAV